MARRLLVIVCALLASGCFRWAPVSSLSSIEDDRVKIQQGSDERTLVHATARGRIIEGQPTEGGERALVDATASRVLARRLNPGATAAIITVSALGVAGTVFAVAVVIIIASMQAIDAGPR